MGGSALLHTITFGAVIVMILLTVWIVLMLETGGGPSRTNGGAATPGDYPGQATAPECKDA